MKTLKQFMDSYDYCETAQQSKIRYAACSVRGDKIVQQTGWFKCRDYFNDFSIANHLRSGYRVYGMDVEPEMCVSKDSEFTFLVRYNNEDEEQFVAFISNIYYHLNPLEEAAGIIPTQVEELPDVIGGYTTALVTADIGWLRTSYFVSYYTLLLRLFSYGVYLEESFDSIRGLAARYIAYDECLFDEDVNMWENIDRKERTHSVDMFEALAKNIHNRNLSNLMWSEDYYTFSDEGLMINDHDDSDDEWGDEGFIDLDTVHDAGIQTLMDEVYQGPEHDFTYNFKTDLLSILKGEAA